MPDQKLNPADKAVLGTTGLPIWLGRVFDEYLLDLSGDQGIRTLREMSEQDPILGGIQLAIELLVRRTPFPVVPADLGADAAEADLKKAADQADFVEGCLDDMEPEWGMTVSEILTLIPYGWAFFELLYKIREGQVIDPLTGLPSMQDSSKYDDGKIGWAGWSIRAQETRWRWEFDDTTGEVKGLWQMAPPRYEINYIPMSKAMLFRMKARKGNPEGTTLYRSAYRPWYFKKQIEKVEGIGIERDLAGLPVAYLPPEYMADDAPDEMKQVFAQVKKLVTQIRNDEQAGIVFPLEYDDQNNLRFELKLLATGGQRSFDTDKIIQRYEQRIAMSFLADFLLLGHQSVGSFALADSKTELFARAVGAVLDTIVGVINKSAIPKLMALNGVDPKYWPKVAHGDLSAPDLNELGTYMQKLALAGMEMFPNKPLEDFLLESAGLPVPDPLDEQDDEFFPDIDPEVLSAVIAEIQNQQAGGAPGQSALLEPGTPAGQQGPPGNPPPPGGPADQNLRTGRSTQSAAARQIRSPGAIRKAPGTGPTGQPGQRQPNQAPARAQAATEAAQQFAGQYSPQMDATSAVVDTRPSMSIFRPQRSNKSAIARDLLQQGHSHSAVARYLDMRPQQVHAARKRIKGVKMLGPNTIADIQNALSGAVPSPEGGGGGGGGGGDGGGS